MDNRQPKLSPPRDRYGLAYTFANDPRIVHVIPAVRSGREINFGNAQMVDNVVRHNFRPVCTQETWDAYVGEFR